MGNCQRHTVSEASHVIQNGWPIQHADLDQELYVFWIHRLNLSIVDGIIMNRTRIVIPKSLQAEYFKCLHTGHFGVSKCCTRTKSTVYWPGIDQDITNLIGSCDVYREVQHTPHTLDEHTMEACYPGHIYGTDIGNIQGKPHVIVVNYFSFFIYERPLSDMTSDAVILALKTIFSEAGVPTILISDNGRQYCSEEFKEFSLQWSFVHKTASPYYPKGNAHAERAVSVVKEVYTKCGDYFLLGLLVLSRSGKIPGYKIFYFH